MRRRNGKSVFNLTVNSSRILPRFNMLLTWHQTPPSKFEKSVFYFAWDGKSYLNSYSAYPPPSDNDVGWCISTQFNMLLTRHQTRRSKLDNHFLILHEMEKAISTVILRIRHLVIMMLQVNMLVTRYQTEIAPLPLAFDSVHSTWVCYHESPHTIVGPNKWPYLTLN